MNCRPGDLAVILGDHELHPETDGRLCDVLHAVEYGFCTLPDGTPSQYFQEELGWVIKLHSPIRVWWTGGGWRDAMYACCPDSRLKPIRDQPGNESWFTAAPKSLPATTKGDIITERGELA